MKVDRVGEVAEGVVWTDDEDPPGGRVEIRASPAHQLDANRHPLSHGPPIISESAACGYFPDPECQRRSGGLTMSSLRSSNLRKSMTRGEE
jgi:hypothetical protein